MWFFVFQLFLVKLDFRKFYGNKVQYFFTQWRKNSNKFAKPSTAAQTGKRTRAVEEEGEEEDDMVELELAPLSIQGSLPTGRGRGRGGRGGTGRGAATTTATRGRGARAMATPELDDDDNDEPSTSSRSTRGRAIGRGRRRQGRITDYTWKIFSSGGKGIFFGSFTPKNRLFFDFFFRKKENFSNLNSFFVFFLWWKNWWVMIDDRCFFLTNRLCSSRRYSRMKNFLWELLLRCEGPKLATPKTTSALIAIDTPQSINQGLLMASRRGQIFLAVFLSDARFAHVACHWLNFSKKSENTPLIWSSFWMYSKHPLSYVWVRKWMFWIWKKKSERRKNVLVAPSLFWFFSNSEHLCFYVWIHAKTILSQGIWTEITVSVVWKKKLLAGGFCCHFPAGDEFSPLASYVMSADFSLS